MFSGRYSQMSGAHMCRVMFGLAVNKQGLFIRFTYLFFDLNLPLSLD